MTYIPFVTRKKILFAECLFLDFVFLMLLHKYCGRSYLIVEKNCVLYTNKNV